MAEPIRTESPRAAGLFDETLSASVQYGTQNEVQIAGMRYGVSSDSGSSLGVEVLTAQAGFGAHNKDGSRARTSAWA